MNLEDITLSEISPSQKDKYCMIPFRDLESSYPQRLKVEGWVPGVGEREMRS